MKLKKGIFRIYIVLSVIWFSFFIYGHFSNYGDELIFVSLIPIPLYFVLKWIADGFK